MTQMRRFRPFGVHDRAAESVRTDQQEAQIVSLPDCGNRATRHSH
jgi:hypothetical protein